MAHGTTASSVTERSSAVTSGGASECETSNEISTTTHRVLLAPSTRPAVDSLAQVLDRRNRS
jgi:hypothetical protein